MTSWPVAALGDMALINPPLDIRPDQTSMVSFVPLASLDAVTAVAQTESARAFQEVAKGYTPFVDGDILVAKITPSFQNCKIGQAHLDHEIGMGSTEFHVIRPSGQVDARYILHFLRQDWILSAGESRLTGSGGQRRVPASFLRELSIPLPPLGEQRRIAGILDAADGLRARRRESIALLDTLTQSIFLDMFGETKHLEQAPLSDLAEVQGGLTVHSKRSKLPVRAPYLRVANVARGSIDLTEVKEIGVSDRELRILALKVHDLLLVEGHGNRMEVGRVARWTEPTGTYVHQNHLIRIRLQGSRVHPVFTEYYLNGSGGRAQVASVAKTTSGLNTISISQVRDLKVPIPPMVQQREFMERVAVLAHQKETALQSLKVLTALFASLQSRAFHGELQGN